ncbi:MAG TPA: hypothetical protein VJM12_05515 [Pyrinomonadaceae bacterium]|nr:hypothetical protein [Pyrinomonadaceae bacterium]
MTPTTDATEMGTLAEVNDQDSPSAEISTTAKKKFIEPELSAPISVAEATRFFQGTTSGCVPNCN